MRKDVKLGLAVGGILLAVLVVYVLVVPAGNSNQAGATLENLDGSEAQTGGSTESFAQGETKTPADSSGNSTQDQQAKSSGATADAGTAGGANGAAGGSTGAGGATATTPKDNASASGGWNWDALVNGTEKLPSMGAGTDVSTNGSILSNGGSSQLGDGATANGSSVNESAAGNQTSANGVATGNDTANQTGTDNQAGPDNQTASGNRTGTATNGGATAQGGADSLSHATAGGAQQSSARQGALGGTQARTQDTAPAPLTTTDAAGKHVVKAGDTYSKISLAVYGTSKHYAEIEHANPGLDPTRLKPGTTINLPAITAKQPSATPAVAGAAAAAAAIDPQKEYKVQPNDSLYTISLRLYGKPDRMEKIYDLNKTAIGDDMARVKVGMVLKLPEPPTQTTAAAQAR
ncbi:MAG: LysM peptidoglycan-binding domain-containing protein [Planctomycetota bacterium]|nr:LysM peptidoglycan-binding domain-containing protein [Planctomycetota bacterium]